VPFRPDSRTDYPSGTCIHTEFGWFYIKNNQRHPIKSQRILDSWAFHRIVPSTEAAVKHLPIAKQLGYRDGSLIEDMKTAKLYIISNGLKCQVTNPDFLTIMNITLDEKIWASHAEVQLHKDGEDIT
jgi:hypothetical protein